MQGNRLRPAARGRRGSRKRAVATASPARDELLALLLRDGILREGAEQKIYSRDGTTAPWMLDSLGFSLSARGAELAARCLLEKLESFEGTQLATYGVTGIPLMQAIVMLSGGRYRGIVVR